MEKEVFYEPEVENTFEIPYENVSKVIDTLITNRSHIEINDEVYILEKAKKVSELHFLMSDKFAVTRELNGTRHRLKFKKGKKNIKIVHTPKRFIDGERFEEKIKLGDDFNQAFKIIHENSDVDAVMFKCSLKYNCINNFNKNKFKISIDCCYAINYWDYKVISEPFYYIEVEENNGNKITLDDFRNSDLFSNKLIHLLSPVRFSSHNKIRMCMEYFPNKALNFENNEHLKSYVEKVFEIFEDEEKYFSSLINDNNLHIKGVKETERTNHIESEFKFVNNFSQQEVIDLIKPLLPDSWKIYKVAPRIIMDMYMDTDNLDLYKLNASFRFRKRKKELGWISCFKKTISDESSYLERRKIRTSLSNKEIMKYKTNDMPGSAADEVYKFLKEKLETEHFDKNNSLLGPMTLVVEHRDRYVIRPRGFVDFDFDKDYSDSQITEEHYTMKLGEMVHIIFDDVTVYDLRNMDISTILNYEELDVTNKRYNSSKFYSAEIEPNVNPALSEKSTIIFNEIVKKLSESNFKANFKDKYNMSIESLKNTAQ